MSQNEYKTIRIYPDDFKKLKRLAFSQDKTIVRLISEAIDLVEEKYKK